MSGAPGEGACADAACEHLLSGFESFLHGALGGGIVLALTVIVAVSRLYRNRKQDPKPIEFNLLLGLMILAWLLVPVISGASAYLIGAHSKFLAALEGVGVLTIFNYFAAHFRELVAGT